MRRGIDRLCWRAVSNRPRIMQMSSCLSTHQVADQCDGMTFTTFLFTQRRLTLERS